MLASRIASLVRLLIVFAVLMVPCAQAALPDFPPKSISPLYGRWTNFAGRTHELMTIGPKWLTSYHGDCPMRMRYRVLAQDVVKYQEQVMLEITLKQYDAEFVGGKAKETCSDLSLTDDSFVKISLIDFGDSSTAGILAFVWEACDTLEHLNAPPDPGHINVKACGAGGGIMNRVRKGRRL